MKSWLFSALAILCVASAHAQSQPTPKQAQAEDATPYRISKASVADSERNKVRVFFAFTCPFSAQAHAGLVRWGTTLPPSMRIEMTPVVTKDQASALGAGYYLAARQLAPRQLEVFTDAVYDEIQHKNGRADTHQPYLAAARRAGISPDALKRTAQGDKVRGEAYSAALLLGAHKIDGTPSVVAGGKYIVTPEVTQGINGNFYQLINAVTSKHLLEAGGT